MAMNIRYISLLLFCALLAVSSASAAPSLYYNDASDISRIGSGDNYFSSGEECIFAAVGTDIRVIYTDESSALKLTAGETIIDVCIGMDGLMYVTTSSGLYREAVGDCTNPRTLGDLVHISEHGGRISAANDGIVMLVGSPYYDITKFSYTTLSVIEHISCPHAATDITVVPDTEYSEYIVVYGSTGVSHYYGSFPTWTNGTLHTSYTAGDNTAGNVAMLSVDADVDSRIEVIDYDYYQIGTWVEEDEGGELIDVFYLTNTYYPHHLFSADINFNDGADTDSVTTTSTGTMLDVALSYNQPIMYYVKSGDVYSDGVPKSRLGNSYTDSIELNATSYHRGNTARIDYMVEDLSSGTYTVVLRDPVDIIQMTETISSPYGYYDYTFADNDTFGNWSINLCLDDTAVETDYTMLVATGLSSVAWDKVTYDLGETGSISYEIGSYNSSIYDYSVDIYKAGILQTHLNCISNVSNVEYTFSSVTENTTYHAKLTKYIKGSSTPLIIVTDSCLVTVDPPVDDSEQLSLSLDAPTYHKGDWVTVTYSTNVPAVMKVFDDTNANIWHYLDVPIAVTNETWQYYIGDSDPYGDFSVLFGTVNSLEAEYYSVTSDSSFVQVVPESMYMYETMTIWYTTDGSSTLSITDCFDTVYFQQTVNSSTLASTTYVPTISGFFTITLQDISLNSTDSISVLWADAPGGLPDDPDPEDVDGDGEDDVLEDDESMTEYFDNKFRGFAPSAWGIFILSIILWLMAILTSFGGSDKRR